MANGWTRSDDVSVRRSSVVTLLKEGGSRHIVVTVGPLSGSWNAPQTAKPTDSHLRRFAGFVDSR
jgi:hypothetical protein